MAEDNKTFAQRIEQEIEFQNSLKRTKAQLEAITDEKEKQIFNENIKLQAIKKAYTEEIKLLKTRDEINDKSAKAMATYYQDMIFGQEQVLEALRKQKQAIEESAQAADDVLRSLMGIAGIKSGAGSSIFKFFENIKTAGFGGFKDKLSDIDQGLINLGITLGERVLEPTITLAMAQDDTISQLKRVTAAGDKYNDLLIESEKDMRSFGVSMGQVAEAIKDLQQQMSLFTEMSAESRMVLTENSALMQQFSIDSSTTAGNLDILTKAFGMNADQAAATNRELFATGQALGMPLQVMNEFGPAMQELAAHGDDAIKVFQGMAAAAKATGLEINTLVGFTTQFDTFEDAAQSAGKLNALLGGPYLNAIELLNAKDHERIRLVIQGLELSGRSFSEMGKFEKKAIANAAGITDMAEANKLFNTSLSAYDAMQVKASAAAISQEEFEEASRDAMGVMEKFRKIMEGFAVSMRPLIEGVSLLLDGVLYLQEIMGNWFGVTVALSAASLVLSGIVIKVVAAVKAFAAAKKALAATSAIAAAANAYLSTTNATLTTSTTAAAAANVKLSTTNATLATSTRAAGTAATFSLKPMLALGAAVVMIGAGIGTAAFGVAELADSFSKMSVGQILASAIAIQLFMAAMGGMLIGLIALVAGPQAALTGAAVVALLAIGGAMLMIGAAVGLAATGIAFAAAGFGYMFSELSKAPEMIIYLGALVAIMGVFGAMSVILVPGMLAMSAAFVSLGASIRAMMDEVELEKLQALATVMTSMRDIMVGPKGGTTASPPPGGDTPGSPFTSMISAVNSLSGEKVDQASRLAAVASSYNNASAAMGGGGRPIILEIDGYRFGKIVKEYAGKGIPVKEKLSQKA